MAVGVNAPIDQLHADCIIERDRIRQAFRQARERAAQWTPKPLDKR